VNGLWLFISAVVVTFAYFAWEEARIRKHHRALAVGRTPLTPEQFVHQMEVQGVSRETAEYLRSWLWYAYRAGLRPTPDDRIYSDVHVLGDDSSALITEYFERQGRTVPDDLDGSKLSDPTLAELGRWLESWK
jgi:hypothetical protein